MTYPKDPPNPTIMSVVVPTRDRPESLIRCLYAIKAQSFSDFEVLVIDNSASESSARRNVAAASRCGARYLRSTIGASHARNLGILHARGDVVVMTDDDCLPSRSWLEEIHSEFRLAVTDCVTGRILLKERPGLPLAEFYVGGDRGPCRRVLVDDDMRLDIGAVGTILSNIVRGQLSRANIFPWTFFLLGGGSNVAFRKEIVTERTLYDERLGPGTPLMAGEDTDFLFRLIADGHRIVYLPRAIVCHTTRISKVQQLAEYAFRQNIGGGACASKNKLRLFFVGRLVVLIGLILASVLRRNLAAVAVVRETARGWILGFLYGRSLRKSTADPKVAA